VTGATGAVLYANGLSAPLAAPGIIITNPSLSGTTVILTCSGDITAFSDRRIKTDLRIIPDSLNKLSQINGYTYRGLDSNIRHTGVIAQEVQRVLPEAVITMSDGMLTVAYGNLVGILIEGIKELEKRIKILEQR
jgi:hypothetical protein